MIPDLISVVVPVKDGARHLPPALESIRAQQGVAFELIVVDDGSTDGSAAVAERLGADRCVRLPVNRGPSTARNVGLAHAAGEFVCFHDGDDEMLAGKLAAQREFLRSDTAAGGVMIDQIVKLERGATLPPWLANVPTLINRPSAALCSALLRVHAVLLAGGFDPTLRIAEDIELFRRMTANGTGVRHSERPLLRRVVHGSNLSYEAEPFVDIRRVARLALTQRRHPAAEVGSVIPEPEDAVWGAAVARNHAVINTRSPILVFPHPGRDDADVARAGEHLARSTEDVEMLSDGNLDTPPLAIRRTALARVGLWPPDTPDALSCTAWWGRTSA